jgi:hypothetical protein
MRMREICESQVRYGAKIFNILSREKFRGTSWFLSLNDTREKIEHRRQDYNTFRRR